MRSASFLMEANAKQAAVFSGALNNVLQLYNWKHIISYEINDDIHANILKLIGEVRDAWWPVARSLLLKAGQLDLGEVLNLRNSTKILNDQLAELLGKENVARLFDPVDAYFVTGPLPLEWIFLNEYPLCLYAPFYRFSRPQDLASMYTPRQEAFKLVIAPSYTKPALAGINGASLETKILAGNHGGVELLAGEFGIESLQRFQDRQFGGLLFHGHAALDGLLASDGTVIPYDAILKLVQGPAFLLGCATGAFESGNLLQVAKQIPNGLHGALMTAFPSSAGYTKNMNLTVMGTFLSGNARRVQDIAHMSRLSLAWIGILHAMARLTNVPVQSNVAIVTPFEASYDQKYDRWGAGVKDLQREMADVPHGDLNELVLSIASAFAMAIV